MPADQNIPAYMRLLDPDALAKLHRLELIARGTVEGFVTGRHRSPYKGFSVEFAEHRQYTPGDDIKELDWRVYARSDRYYVKQYVQESNLRATILVDASGSMAYTGEQAAEQNGSRLSKFQYAQRIAAALAHLLIHQQDAVGLVTFDTEVRDYIPARSRVSHLRALLEALDETEPGGETAPAPIFHDIAERVHRRGLLIVLSDLFDDPDRIVNALHHFRYCKHEVIILHVMAAEELSFPFDGQMGFRDLELPQERLRLNVPAVRRAYLEQMRDFLRALRLGCGRMKADYVQLSTADPYEVALADYLARRRRQTT